MSARPAPRTSRRAFLKLGAAAAAGLALWGPAGSKGMAGSAPLRIGSALPLPLPHEFLPDPDWLSANALDRFDLLLAPAYVAARLIRRGLIMPLRGPAGRAHDPEGAYTVPFVYRVSALRYPEEPAGPGAASLEELWSAPAQTDWPASARLMIGMALLRRGYSPNDTHPGHLALAGDDLARLSSSSAPQFEAPDAASAAGRKSPVLVLADPADVASSKVLRLPVEGALLVEYDWAIPAGTARAEASRQFIRAFKPDPQPPHFEPPARLIPLMPLPDLARAQHAEIWEALAASRTPVGA